MESTAGITRRLRTARGRAGRALRRSTFAVRVKRRVERHLRGENSVDVVTTLPALAPYSEGTYQERARLTLQTAARVIPLLASVAAANGHELIEPVDVTDFRVGGQDPVDATRLRELFDRYGSDKASDHDYHHLYSAVLGAPDRVTTVVEIGLGTNNTDVVSTMGPRGRPGASLRAFRDYLPNARVYGADVDRRVLFTEDRIETCFVDQTDEGSFTELGSLIDGEIDLIIDDGLHSPDANLAVLLFALPRLRVGGSVVIEDISPDAQPLWQIVELFLRDSYDTALVSATGAMMFAVRRRD